MGRCSFEPGEPCLWDQVGFQVVLARDSNGDNKSSSLPYRDHTLNQGGGSFSAVTIAQEIALLYSPEILPSQQCQVSLLVAPPLRHVFFILALGGRRGWLISLPGISIAWKYVKFQKLFFVFNNCGRKSFRIIILDGG